MQEAYLGGYWKELAAFTRSLFNATFKNNPYLERAIMTGITRVSKESIFSDLNNLVVVTATSKKYTDAFGFTEEVDAALKEYGLSNRKSEVKRWYNGFKFGDRTDIYNPWSITNYLDNQMVDLYWANTSNNSLIAGLIQKGARQVKETFEKLLSGNYITTQIDEQIIYEHLDLEITNFEVKVMFRNMVRDWFASSASNYNESTDMLTGIVCY